MRYAGNLAATPCTRRHPLAVLLIVLALAAGAWPFAAPAQSPKAEFKLSTAVGPAYPWGKGAEIWAQLVKERTAGRIVIKLFPGASATGGDPAREFAALREGTIDLAVGSALNWTDAVQALNLFALPFMVGDSKALDALLRGATGTAVLRAVEAAGVVPLAWGDNGFRDISTADRALNRPADVAGLRIRTAGPLPADEALAALGAMPSRMKWPEAQSALLGGTLDGQETTLLTFVATKAHTLGQKHLTLWALAADPLIFAVNRAVWEGWTPDDREIVRQAAVEAAERETDLARRGAATAEAAMGRDLKAAGVSVHRATAAERAAFAAATRPVYDKWAAVAGVDMVKGAEDAIAAVRRP